MTANSIGVRDADEHVFHTWRVGARLPRLMQTRDEASISLFPSFDPEYSMKSPLLKGTRTRGTESFPIRTVGQLACFRNRGYTLGTLNKTSQTDSQYRLPSTFAPGSEESARVVYAESRSIPSALMAEMYPWLPSSPNH
jgi:hypothetical protein